MRIYLLFLVAMTGLSCSKKECSYSYINTFDFPNSIEEMAASKYICSPLENRWSDYLQLEFADKNFTLLKHDEKTKILVDKNEDMILCIKSNEADNFQIIFNDKENFTYGINEIFYLDKNLMPLFSFDEGAIYKYSNDSISGQSSYARIDSLKAGSFSRLAYRDILALYKTLSEGNYTVNDTIEVSPYYRRPYAWGI